MGRGARRRAETSNAVFADLVGGDLHPEPTLLGVEQEFSLFDAEGRQVDARSLLQDLGMPGARLDPGDPFARRLPWGGALTADGPEAEIATPPVALASASFGRVADLATHGQEQLTTALPAGMIASGYSTHLSIAVDDRLIGRVAALYASTFACGLMLLTQRQDSPGLLVRPRPGRLELCTEFVDGELLQEALAFAAGSVLAVTHAVATGDRSALIPAVAVNVAPAVDRFGWYVDRRAFGVDLHVAWGATVLQLEHGGSMSAAEHLELSWASVRRHVDAGESGRPIGGGREGSPHASSPFGEAVEPRIRPSYRLEARIATWDFTVYRIEGEGRDAYACVPRRALSRFLDAVDSGELDGAIVAYLHAATGGGPLVSAEQTETPGLFAAVGPASALLSQEGGLDFTGGGPRRGKRRRNDDRDQEQRDHDQRDREDRGRSRRAQRVSPKAKLVAGAVAAMVAFGAIAFATSRPGGGSGDGPDRVGPGGSAAGAATGSAPEPPLGEVRVEGPFRRTTGWPMPMTMEVTPVCDEGPCDAAVAGKDPTGPVEISATYADGSYVFEGTLDSRCPDASLPGPNRPWIFSFEASLRVTETELIDGVWRATELSGPMDVSWPRVSFNNGLCHPGKSSGPVEYVLER